MLIFVLLDQIIQHKSAGRISRSFVNTLHRLSRRISRYSTTLNKMQLLHLLLPLGGLATRASTAPLKPRAPTCVDGVMIVAARGSDGSWMDVDATNPNYASIGGMQKIADEIIAAVGQGSFLSAVPYPASGDFSEYGTSLGHGIDATQSIIKDYVDQCKGTVKPRVVVRFPDRASYSMLTHTRRK